MNKHISAIRQLLCRTKDQSGEVALAFGLILPLLVVLSLAIVEFTLVIFDYSRASEATRLAARIASLDDPVGDLSDLENTDVVCTAGGGAPTCTGGAAAANDTFDRLLAAMQVMLPAIGAGNVKVVYRNSGIGTPESGGIKPLVSVSLINLQRPFIFLQAVTGVAPSLTYPGFATTYLAGGEVPS